MFGRATFEGGFQHFVLNFGDIEAVDEVLRLRESSSCRESPEAAKMTKLDIEIDYPASRSNAYVEVMRFIEVTGKSVSHSNSEASELSLPLRLWRLHLPFLLKLLKVPGVHLPTHQRDERRTELSVLHVVPAE